MRYLGIDIGGTKTAVLLGDEQADTLARIEFATDHAGGPEAVLERVVEAAREVCDGAGAALGDLAGAGISCGGPLDSARGVVLGPPNLPGWDDVPVVDYIARATGLPAFLENDANAGAVAEWQFGAGRGCRNVVFITAGTGLGCGLVLDGRLYSGTNDMAGEAGHVRLDDYGPQGYGKFGSLEGFCSGAGIAKLAARELSEATRRGGRSALYAKWTSGEVTTKDVAEAALQGDKLACEVMRKAGEYLGQGLSILIDILNPEVIVLGSLAVRLGELYLGPAREVIAREALPRAAAVCRIVPAQLGERIGDVAALCVAMRLGRNGASPPAQRQC